MAKQLTIGEKIRRYMEAHPDAPPKKIAQDLNVKVGYVHNLRSLDKKSLAEGKPIRRIKRTYVKKPKKMIITAKEAAVAQRLGIDLKTYAEGKAEFMKLKRKAKLTSESFPKVGDSVGGLTLTRRALPDNTYMYRWVRDDLVKSGKVQVDASLPASLPEPELPITMEEPKHDPVNHPAHYKVGGIETIDFIEAKKLGYNLGNVVKYITRADHKGNTYEDLCKARWYLNREINSLAGEAK